MTDSQTQIKKIHGSLLLRVLAYVVDHFVASFAGLLVMGVLLRGLISAGLYGTASLIFPNLGPGPVDTVTLWASYSFLDKLRVMTALIALPRWVYMTAFQGSPLQATPGKMLLGLKVVNALGLPVGYKTAALRSLVRGLLFVLTFGLSGIVNLVLIQVRPKRQAIHDLVVGSEVVRRRI
jgi:uncharacterized RDD family membrane protein YckC